VSTVTSVLGFTRNYWSAVENERRVLTEDKLDILVELYELDEDERHELKQLRAAAKQRGWWSSYSALFNEHTLRLYGLEYGAHSVQSYGSLLVPGLLQAEPYVRALMSFGLPTTRAVEIEPRVQVRLLRQRRLTGDDPLRLSVLLSEAALVQRIGGPEVQRAQLDQLLRVLDELPHVEVRVIPFTATGSGVLGASNFHLLDFASPRLPTQGWYELVTIGSVITDKNVIRDLSVTYFDAFKQALSREDSIDLIREHRV
jgi:uncharacterized protein DUF5753/helix-turn-helix protein